MSKGLRETRQAALRLLVSAHGLKIVYLFGSQAELGRDYLEGKDPILADPLADLDIGVVRLAGETSPLEHAELYGSLSLDFQSLFAPFDIDLVLLEEAHSVLQAEAIAGDCIYAESQDLREEYEERTLARAADFRPFLELFYRERLEETGSHGKQNPR